MFGDAVKGADVARLVEFGNSLGIPVKYVAWSITELARRRDMGLVPGEGGLTLSEMLAANLDVLWVVGANPLKRADRGAGV